MAAVCQAGLLQGQHWVCAFWWPELVGAKAAAVLHSLAWPEKGHSP